MGWLHKSRTLVESAGETSAQDGLRTSNGLKDFLWLLGDVGQGQMLDLGAVSQSTVAFFTERGFKVYTEDLLRAWRDFLRVEEDRLRSSPLGKNGGEEQDRVAMAERFLAANCGYPAQTFHAVLAWDLLDYLDEEVVPRIVERLHEILLPGGVMLAVFHSKPPSAFHHYRVVDAENLELLPTRPLVPHRHILQNREILNQFSRFRSSKTFIGRDQLREAVFLK